MALAMSYEHDPVLTLGERMATSRHRAGLDQQDIADQIGVSRPLVSKWERGKSLPNVEQAARWAEITGVSFGWLGGVNVRSRCFSVDLTLVPALDDHQGTLDFDPVPRADLRVVQP